MEIYLVLVSIVLLVALLIAPAAICLYMFYLAYVMMKGDFHG